MRTRIREMLAEAAVDSKLELTKATLHHTYTLPHTNTSTKLRETNPAPLPPSLPPPGGPSVPFVNRPFESEIHGTANFTNFCCVLLVTWCHRVRFLCYLRPK